MSLFKPVFIISTAILLFTVLSIYLLSGKEIFLNKGMQIYVDCIEHNHNVNKCAHLFPRIVNEE